ncbi:hypothetical protein D9758_013820 [Tetrapyrgos nigripes]|uniref:DUF1996 domain-containing protein n=1 Tax=Tetrapyrgos nigripes TaxID=182062 RepID=A0A8H5CTV1_9AGAR|nr:hypothetical protein D9758_013820 [Tetrapyrgos nigripes]
MSHFSILRTVTVLVFLTLGTINTASAWFRLPCTDPLVQERIDPIISPGKIPSQHVHTVHGASNFAANSTFDTLRASKCTSCQVSQDLSNYWFPKLYFRDPKTKMFEAVSNGGELYIRTHRLEILFIYVKGLLIYYQNRGSLDKINGGPGLKAFPPGFRMITGNPVKRTKVYPDGLGTQEELGERAIAWACLRYTTSNADYYGTGSFPHTDCEVRHAAWFHPSLLVSKVVFISPRAGTARQNVDSPDHKSHVAYLSILDNGSCPSTHPVGLMKLFYEITWNIHDFTGRWQESDGWPFVWVNSLSIRKKNFPDLFHPHRLLETQLVIPGTVISKTDGTLIHPGSVLQKAIDNCNNPNDDTINGVISACPYFNLIDPAKAVTCKTNPVVNEPVSGSPMAKLPGCNPIQTGPGDATLYNEANCPI